MFRLTETKDHCYVYQQPQTDEQLGRMIRVMECADLQCVRCRSRDPKLLSLLKKSGLKDQCDHSKKSLFSRIPEIFRKLTEPSSG